MNKYKTSAHGLQQTIKDYKIYELLRCEAVKLRFLELGSFDFEANRPKKMDPAGLGMWQEWENDGNRVIAQVLPDIGIFGVYMDIAENGKFTQGWLN